MTRKSYITYAVQTAAACIGVFTFTIAQASWFSPKTMPSLADALQSLKTSVNALAQTKDDTPPAEKDQQEFRAKVQTLQKIIELGLVEAKDLKARLADLHIEELVADDFTFDAVETSGTFVQMLQSFDAYYSEAEKKLLEAKNVSDVKAIAVTMRAWREKTYNPGVRKILSLGLLLQNRVALKTAAVRFDKILADLRKLKGAELITMTTLEPLVTSSGASLKKAKALHEDATNIVLRMLRERPGMPAETGDAELISPHERISNLVDQSFAELRGAYKTFMEVNIAVKKMLGIE
ncbi:MAG: hypothetical protein Q7R85_02270 [bacterium]|nr:hypothetical protein [bacterium]